MVWEGLQDNPDPYPDGLFDYFLDHRIPRKALAHVLVGFDDSGQSVPHIGQRFVDRIPLSHEFR